MKPSDFQKTIQCQFDCKLKKVVKGIVRNYRKELARRQAKEVSFCELPEIVVEKLIVWDDYESEYTTFDVCGTEIRVLDEALAEALKQLQQEYHSRFMTILPPNKVFSVIKAEER